MIYYLHVATAVDLPKTEGWPEATAQSISRVLTAPGGHGVYD
jgi:hypothetical protein